MKKKLVSNVKDYRLKKGMNQQQLADAVEVRRETIIRLERGDYNPSLQLAMDISEVLEVSIYELFHFEHIE